MFYGFIHTVPQPGPFACQAQAMHVLILDESRTARAAVPSPTHITPTLKGAMTQPNLPVNIGRQSHAHERCPMKKLERHTQHRGCDPQSMCRVDRGACRRGAAQLAGLLSSRCWLGRPLRQVDDGGTRLLLPQGIDAHSDLGNWARVARAMAVGRGVYPSELPL